MGSLPIKYWNLLSTESAYSRSKLITRSAVCNVQYSGVFFETAGNLVVKFIGLLVSIKIEVKK